ncbi:ATP synthase F1 subcomplex delta subunit [Cyclonatronum proteinivorum]|uniref:ATP synthase subunit delta n=1 Tax=Cyclonatronum proteinivorum TaxID=1457365 RepID=A0A345UJ18_9BACT|nr:ATP synthase F1 subunit delta [Cyclonatronum proteinivorum]AXJ00470.1 ATP synthase F1 subcomplex delta subunit [Cyclonatronum proteinivorum]
MIPSKAARRYSSALLGFAIETNTLERILSDMEYIHKTIEHSRELVLFLRNPLIKADKKRDAINQLFGSKVCKEVNSFFDLVASKARFDLIPGIAKAFIDAYRKHKGIELVHLFYAEEPNADQIDRIKKALESKTGKTIELISQHKPGLLGGVMVKIDDTVIDGSVKHKLEQLQHLFFKAAI